MTYIDGLEGLIMNKDKKTEWQTILHTDQGAVYASKKYNDILELNHIAHSMSRSGTPKIGRASCRERVLDDV